MRAGQIASNPTFRLISPAATYRRSHRFCVTMAAGGDDGVVFQRSCVRWRESATGAQRVNQTGLRRSRIPGRTKEPANG